MFLKLLFFQNILYRKDDPKTDLFSGRVRLQNIIKNKRIPSTQIMKQNIAKIKNNNLISVGLGEYLPKQSKSNEIMVCNGTITPPMIRGFTGPLSNIELQRMVSNNGYSSSEIYLYRMNAKRMKKLRMRDQTW